MNASRTERPGEAGRAPTSLAALAASSFGRYRSGDSGAMGSLVDQVTPLLWHTARAQGADPVTAEDVVQTTWLRLVEHAEAISDPQAVLQWLLMTAKREAWSTVKQVRRTVPRESWDEPDRADPTLTPAGDPAQASEDAELASTVWRHVQQLPERCQQLLRLVAFVDRPDYHVVSTALGIPVGSIGPTRGRCLAKLKVSLMADPTWEVTA